MTARGCPWTAAIGPHRSEQRLGVRRARQPVQTRPTISQRDSALSGRCVNKLKQLRAVATRSVKREYVYQGTVEVASIRIWLRDPVT